LVVNVVVGGVGAAGGAAGAVCAVWAKPGRAAYTAARKQRHRTIRPMDCTHWRVRDFACFCA
ncbi:MAG: hypothetical protein WA183_02030, partial [Chthoniobacterales bacterium]